MKHTWKFLWLLALVFLNSSLLWAAEEKMVVMNVQGDGQIIRQNESIPAVPGMESQPGDILKTGANCQIDVALNGLTGCRVLPGSDISVIDLKASDMQLRVNSGNVVLNLKKLPQGSSFKLETPTALASVRGTQFWGRVENKVPDNPITTFAVRDGTVEIFDKVSSQSFMLEKGQALDLPKNSEKAPSLRSALPGEMQAMEQADDIPVDA
jgi:hypothetical protein